MIYKDVVLKNETGLHSRLATRFVQEANKYKSNITIISEDRKANAKSIIGVMSLGVYSGEVVTLEASGIDKEEALEALIRILENK